MTQKKLEVIASNINKESKWIAAIDLMLEKAANTGEYQLYLSKSSSVPKSIFTYYEKNGFTIEEKDNYYLIKF